MPYSTQADVQNALGGAKRLVEAFDWDEDDVPDATAIADCIAEADSLIDSFAGKRYTVPFATPTEIITKTSARLAVLIGARRRGMLTMDQQTQWDQLAGTETGKEGWLYRLATGVVTPGVEPQPPASPTMQTDFADTQLPAERELDRCKLGW